MRILVCGGAGYIGAHMCKLLAAHGHDVAVADNLSTGHRAAVQWSPLWVGDIGDAAFLETVFAQVRPEAVLHFAALSQVGESMAQPAAYRANNIDGTLKLLERVRRSEGCRFVFSSSAAVYGEPRTPMIDEAHPRAPVNVYGQTKLAIEDALAGYAARGELSSISLRYFNAAGADASGAIGEAHQPETHLIPAVLESLLERGDPIQLFGDDYDTEDGTCVRDYIHVDDLCRAHLLGLDFIARHPGAHFMNLGNGRGFSVKEVIAAIGRVTQREVPCEIVARRPGDPARLVADAGKAQRELGWTPRIPALDDIIASAWRWHRDRKF